MTDEPSFRLGLGYEQLLSRVTEIESNFKLTLSLTRMIAKMGSCLAKEVLFVIDSIASSSNPRDSYRKRTCDRVSELHKECVKMVAECHSCAASFETLEQTLKAVCVGGFLTCEQV